MEKSIESIWKQGFLNSDALVAPKLNNLYNQKFGWDSFYGNRLFFDTMYNRYGQQKAFQRIK